MLTPRRTTLQYPDVGEEQIAVKTSERDEF